MPLCLALNFALPDGYSSFPTSVSTLPAQTSPAASADFFETKVRPVLANNCYNCHGNSQLGGLRLDSREGMLKGGKSGPAIVPGDPTRAC